MAYFFGVDFLFVENSELVKANSELQVWRKIVSAIKRPAKPALRRRGPRFD